MRRMYVPETCCPPLPPRVPRRPNSSARRALFPGALRNNYSRTAVECPSRGNTPPWPPSHRRHRPSLRWLPPPGGRVVLFLAPIRPCFGCRKSDPAVAGPHPAAARPIDRVTAAQRRRRRGVLRVAGGRCGPVRAPLCHWSAGSRLRPRRHDRTAAEAVAIPDLSLTAPCPPLLPGASPPLPPPTRRHDRDRQCKKVHTLPRNTLLSALATRAPSSLGRPRGHRRSRGQPADTPRPLLLCHEPAPHIFFFPLFLSHCGRSLPPPTDTPSARETRGRVGGWLAGGREDRPVGRCRSLDRTACTASSWAGRFPAVACKPRDRARRRPLPVPPGWSHRGKSGDGACTREGHPARSACVQRGGGEGSVCGRANSPSQGLAD